MMDGALAHVRWPRIWGGVVVHLDESFLAEVGLADLPATERQSLLHVVGEELGLRVGVALSDGLSDGQLAEFEAIIDKDYDRIVAWLDTCTPDFADDPLYQLMVLEAGASGVSSDIVCEYAATKWLEVNRPDYRDVVAAAIDELKSELRRDAARLLGSSTAAQNDGGARSAC